MKHSLAEQLPTCIPRYEILDITAIEQDCITYYQQLSNRLGNKMIVKPTSGAGSFNITIINSADDLHSVYRQICCDQHQFTYEIDEYISGKMYQCDSIVRNGRVIFAGILELGCSNFDFVLGKPLSVYPVINKNLYQRLFAFNQQVITVLGFQDGSTHHELFIQDGTQEIIFLEIAARVPGGIGVPFHHGNSDINLIDINLLLAADLPLHQWFHPQMKNNMVAALLPVGHGKVIELNKPDLTSPWHIEWHIAPGDTVDACSLIDTAGILTFTNDKAEILRQDFEKLQDWIPVTCIRDIGS